MKEYQKENEENPKPPDLEEGLPADMDLMEEPIEPVGEEEPEEPVQWDGSEAELVSEGADQDYRDTVTGVKLSYVLTEQEIYTCMKGTQFGPKRKKRTRVQLAIFSVLFLLFLVFFFWRHDPNNLFFATVCAAFIFIMIFLPDIRIKQEAKRHADGKEICMEVYPHKIEMGRDGSRWEIPLDGSCQSAVYQQNIVVYFQRDDMVILPMRCVEPSVLPEVQATIQAGTRPREE